MPSLRPGPALAILFTLGLLLHGTFTPGNPGEASNVAEPLLRWIAGGLLLAATLCRVHGSRVLLIALLAVTLGALRGAAVPKGAVSGIGLPEGPARVEAWVAQVPVVVLRPSRDPRGLPRPHTRFHTCDPGFAVSVDGRAPFIEPGQKLLLHGQVGRKPPWRNPGSTGSRFRNPLLWVQHPRAVRVIDYDHLRRPLADFALALRARAHGLVLGLYPEKTAGFLIAILLGDRRLLPREYRKSMARTGTIHFLAVSGLHVGMAMALVIRLPLPRRIRFFVRLGFLLTLTLLTGGAPPVARAAVMLGVHCLGEFSGRTPRPLDTLGWAVLFLLAMNPAWVFELGFCLSVTAVFSIITWAPALLGEDPSRPGSLRRLQALGRTGGSSSALQTALRLGKRSLAISIATSAGTAPLILHFFYRVHPLGPLWNLLVMPVVSLLLLGGGLSVALAAIHPSLGSGVAWITELLSQLLFGLLGVLERVPGSCIDLPPPPLWATITAQALLVVSALARKVTTVFWPLVFAVLLLASVLTLTGWNRFRGPELLVLDVGGGSCALLRVPDSGSYLFDCGSSGLSGETGERIARALLFSGVRRLSGVILSHPHADHIGGILELSEIIPIARVWVSPHFERFAPGKLLLEQLRVRGIPVEEVSRGQCIVAGKTLRLEILHPPLAETLHFVREANEVSVVVKARVEGVSILLPGDIEEAGTARLLEDRNDLRSDLLVLPHHGRRNLLLGELVERVHPRGVIISGDGAGGGQEALETLRRSGTPTAATWVEGAVWARFDGNRLSFSFPCGDP